MTNHVTPVRTYYLVFAGLIALTATTVGLDFVNLGAWHTVAGLLIAAAKSALVMLFFMHVIYSNRLIWVVALGGIFWLVILISYTLTDYLSRGWLPIAGR